MRVERRKLTALEWAAITSSRPVVLRVLDRGESLIGTCASKLERVQHEP